MSASVPMPRVLDPASGSRMMWFARNHPDVIFGDIRQETFELKDKSSFGGKRILSINPDQIMDFRKLPFDDESFNLIAFDPPHLKSAGPKSWLRAKYGMLSENWKSDLSAGFAECFRVLKHDGVLVFKWNEDQIPISEILKLTPCRPLFGNTTGRKGLTHWMVFIK